MAAERNALTAENARLRGELEAARWVALSAPSRAACGGPGAGKRLAGHTATCWITCTRLCRKECQRFQEATGKDVGALEAEKAARAAFESRTHAQVRACVRRLCVEAREGAAARGEGGGRACPMWNGRCCPQRASPAGHPPATPTSSELSCLPASVCANRWRTPPGCPAGGAEHQPTRAGGAAARAKGAERGARREERGRGEEAHRKGAREGGRGWVRACNLRAFCNLPTKSVWRQTGLGWPPTRPAWCSASQPLPAGSRHPRLAHPPPHHHQSTGQAPGEGAGGGGAQGGGGGGGATPHAQPAAGAQGAAGVGIARGA